jgi:hypothetical protein
MEGCNKIKKEKKTSCESTRVNMIDM